MKTNLDLANTVSRHVEFRLVNLTKANVTSNVDPYAEVAPELVYSQAYRATYEIPDERPDSLNVVVELLLKAGPPDSEIQTVELNASFVLLYGIPDPASHDEAALDAFASLNGPYHIWPYWRELVSTVTGRIGLSPFYVPVLKLPVVNLDEEESGTEPKARRTSTRRKPPSEARKRKPRQ